MVFLSYLLNPAAFQKCSRSFSLFFSKFCVGSWFHSHNMYIKMKLILFCNFFFGLVILLNPAMKEKAFLCFFRAGVTLLRRWYKFLSIFLAYLTNLEILSHHSKSFLDYSLRKRKIQWPREVCKQNVPRSKISHFEKKIKKSILANFDSNNFYN